MEPHYYEREALVEQNSSWGCSNGRGCRWLFGHRKFGIIAPLNFAIISSGRTDGGRAAGCRAGCSEVVFICDL